MRVQVKTFARFKELFGGDFSMDLEDGTRLGEALAAIGARSKEINEAMFDPSGNIRSYLIIMVNRRRIKVSAGEDAVLREDDEIAILPPVAGG